MIKKKYIDFLKDSVEKRGGGSRYFIFGSSTRKEKFGDIDLGFYDKKQDKKKERELQSFLEESNFPYFVDIVNFSHVEKNFVDYVEKNEKKI